MSNEESGTTQDTIPITLHFFPQDDNSGVKVTWSSEIGEYTSDFSLPYNPEELSLVIKALDVIQYPVYPKKIVFDKQEQETLNRLGLWVREEGDGRIHQEAAKTIGQKLYAALVADRQADRVLSCIQRLAELKGKPLSFRLCFPSQPVELSALPWELLWDSRDMNGLLLSYGNENIGSCVRYLDVSKSIPDLQPRRSGKDNLHILALSPHYYMPESTRREEREKREESWGLLKQNFPNLTWDELSPVTLTGLTERLYNGPKPHIIHYFGHGIYKDGKGHLMFDHETKPSHYDLVDHQKLSLLIRGIHLIVLQACQTAMVYGSESKGELFTGLAPALQLNSQTVLAMQLKVATTTARLFYDVFYQEIVKGQSLQQAVAFARKRLAVNGASWYVPTLYIRMRDQKPVYIVQPA